MKRAFGVMLLAVLAGVGCAAQFQSELRNVTAGHIGCAPQDIEIEDDQPGWGTRSWVAICQGRRYQCSGMRGSMSCAEVHAQR